jgi:uncharacterized phage protein (TIGR01671 family)
MRTLKFRFIKDKKIQGILELKKNNILDMAWEWDEVNQFTGLFDKLGNEIYEGDIVEHIVRYKVEYFLCKGSYAFVRIDDKNRYEMAEYLRQNQTDDSFMKVEIIGNVWENPESLKEKENER